MSRFDSNGFTMSGTGSGFGNWLSIFGLESTAGLCFSEIGGGLEIIGGGVLVVARVLKLESELKKFEK